MAIKLEEKIMKTENITKLQKEVENQSKINAIGKLVDHEAMVYLESFMLIIEKSILNIAEQIAANRHNTIVTICKEDMERAINVLGQCMVLGTKNINNYSI